MAMRNGQNLVRKLKLNADLIRTPQPRQKRSKNRTIAEIEEEPQAAAKAKHLSKKNTTPEAEAKREDATRARSRSKNRSTAEIEEEKRIAEAKEQEPQAKEQEPQAVEMVAKTRGRPKKIITPEEEAKHAEANRARAR